MTPSACRPIVAARARRAPISPRATRPRAPRVALALALTAAAGCGAAEESGGVAFTADRTRRVLFVGLDGVRPDALELADTPVIDRLASEGAFSFEASTQLETATYSGPGWASVLTGTDADKHGVIDNASLATNRDYPTFLLRARTELGKRSAVVTNWYGILALIEDEAEEPSEWIPNDAGVATRMSEIIDAGAHDVHFVQLDEVDHTGHETGFDPASPEYVAEIEEKDAQLGEMLAAVEARAGEKWLVVVTTDHGGEGTDHGAETEVNRTVFLILWGSDVTPGEIAEATHMDGSPTALSFLGAAIDPAWGLDGRVVAMP